jgi:hypothetical protein
MKNLNALHMTASPHSAMVGVGWTDDAGERLHVWLAVANNPATGRSEPVSPYRVKIDRPLGHRTEKAVLYRNPLIRPDGSHPKRGDADHFSTRYLDANAASNAPVVAEALRRAEAEGLYEQALVEHERAEAEREATQRAEKAGKMREQLNERAGRATSLVAARLIKDLLESDDDDLLVFCHLG